MSVLTQVVREESRQGTSGGVWLSTGEAGAPEIHGRLVDVSRSGFRATHHDPLLADGQRVRFRWRGSAGVARVVWSRTNNGTVETGFRVVSRDRNR